MNKMTPDSAALSADLVVVDQAMTKAADGAEELIDSATVTTAEAANLELSAEQQIAIVKLTAGHSRRDAAIAAGVDRRTLYRWMNDDVNFQAAFNAWQRDVTNTVQVQLLAASQDAARTVIKSIRNGNDRLAWELLKVQGMTRSSKLGPTDAGELRRHQEMARKKMEIDDRRERNQVAMDDLITGVE